MAGFLGRANTLTWGGVSLAGVRERNIKINGEPVDVTSGEDNGVRQLLSSFGESTCDIDISGIVKSKTLLTDWSAGTIQKTLVWTRSDGSVISGTFNLVSIGESDPYKDASTFDASFQSAGTWTITP